MGLDRMQAFAEAAGLGRMGIHRNLIHPKFGNFVLLGYREARHDGDGYQPVPGTGLGILREEASAEEFQAVPINGDRALIVH